MQQLNDDAVAPYQSFISNIFLIFLSTILHKFQLYPCQVFETKNVFGLEVISIKKSSLLDYVLEIQEQIKLFIKYVKIIEITLQEHQQKIITFQINLDLDQKYLESVKISKHFEANMALKTMIFNIQNQLKQINYPIKIDQEIEFSVKIHTDGNEINDSKVKEKLLYSWIDFKDNYKFQDQILIESLNIPGCDLGISYYFNK